MPLSLEDKGCLVEVDPPALTLLATPPPQVLTAGHGPRELQACSFSALSWPPPQGRRGKEREAGGRSSQDAKGKFLVSCPAYSYCSVVWG